MELSHCADSDLLSDVTNLIGSHREITASLVAYLGEIEDRRLHLKVGFPSMFAFCVRELGLGETEAFRRIVAARLGRRFPVIHEMLASGSVHLSALELLRDRLSHENHVELLEAVSGKSKREVELLLAARFPRPDVPSRIRPLPSPERPGAANTSSFQLEPCESGPDQRVGPARVEPLSADRYRVEFTASAELREKLDLCRNLMSHANPTRDLGVVIERSVDLLLADLERKRLARTKRPARKKPGAMSNDAGVSVRITNSTRRRVFERDGVQCTYVSPHGRRCDARAFLELDHAEPRALGGASDVGNLRVRCRAHNQLAAEDVFGREHVEHRKHFRQRKWRASEPARDSQLRRGQPQDNSLLSVFEKVRLALTKMGFRDGEARHAVQEVQQRHGEPVAVEQVLREAVLVATAKCA